MGHIAKYIAQHGSSAKGHKFGANPLRKILSVTRYAEGMFDKDSVVFECGHSGTATANAKRGRCKDCGKTQEATR